jgi:hypothetical protein
MLPPIEEVRRLPAPANLPQGLACGPGRLWLSSRAKNAVYELDPERWTVLREYESPGTTYGLTVRDSDLRAVVGEEDDDRYLRRFIPGQGFDAERTACPDDTGSYLGYSDGQLYLTQWYKQKLLFIDDRAHVSKTFDAPHQICGCTVANRSVYLLTTDDEETYDYFITRVDVGGPSVTAVDVAHVPFHGRSLGWDGEKFWTNLREADQVIAFTIPGVEDHAKTIR